MTALDVRSLGDLVDAVYRTLLFLPPPASTAARSLDHLHFFEMTVMNVVAIALACVAVTFLWRYRRAGRPGRPPRVVAPLPLEIGVYGAIFGFFALFWAIGVRQFRDFAEAPDGALEVHVTAKQWMWKFAYPEGAASVGVLYVPAGRPVRLVITSRDVVHSFYVPDFRLKRDAVPGRYTGIWFEAPAPGTHQVLCAEMCGTGHSAMEAEVRVLAPEDFQAWLREGQAALPADASRRLADLGRDAALRHGCFQCHSVNGARLLGPTWQGLYGSAVALQDGSHVRADEAYLTESMMDPNARIVQGFAPVMPSFQGQLSEDETAAIVELIRSLANDARAGGSSP